jgi:hypothetical protein
MSSLTSHGVISVLEEGSLLRIEGQCRASVRDTAPAQSRRALQDPFPQALDSQPDSIFAVHPQVAADSKPHLAESVGVTVGRAPRPLSAGS